jgi:hypothetical protein
MGVSISLVGSMARVFGDQGRFSKPGLPVAARELQKRSLATPR